MIIGLCGYAGVGKDSAAENMPGFERVAFADALKRDLSPLLRMLNCDLNNPEHKNKVRPLLVAWGATSRSFIPDFWIHRLFDRLVSRPEQDPKEHMIHHPRLVISDVRYSNECQEMLRLGGQVIRIIRDGYGPANEEEGRSIAEIERTFCLPVVANDASKDELGRRVLMIAGVGK